MPWTGLALVLVAYGALFSTGGPDPLIVTLCFLAVVACLAHDRLELPPRALLPLALPVMLVALYQPVISPTSSSFGGPGSFRVACIAGTYLLLLVVRRKDFTGHLLMAAGATSLLIASGMRIDGEVSYGSLCLAAAVLLALYLRELRAPLPRRNLPGVLLAFIPVVLLAVLTAFLAWWSETKLGMFLSFFTPPTPVAMQFASRTPLDAMQRSAGQDALVARLFSPSPPTYLVARRYAIYTRDEVWDSQPGPSESLPQSERRLANVPTFQLAEPRTLEQVDRVELETAAGGQLMATRDSWLLAAPLEKLERAPSSGLYFKGVPAFPGTFWLGRGGKPPADPRPGPIFLGLPDNLPPIVRRTAFEVTRGAATARAQAEKIEAFLQTQFTYGFGYPFRKGSPHLEQFLEERPAAHCEFFATAMVTMLRSLKVPARYVVGFIVDTSEYNDLGGFYALRAHHAHAWVEVYIEGAGWVTYDPTPPNSRMPTRNWGQRALSQLGDVIGYWFKQARGFFRLSPAAMLKAALGFVSQPWVMTGLGLLVLGYYAFRLRFHRGRAQRARRRHEGSLGRLLERFETQMRAHELERPDHWTLLEWRQRLEHEELGEPAREFLEVYCRARYGARQAEDELEACLARIEAIKPKGRRKNGSGS